MKPLPQDLLQAVEEIAPTFIVSNIFWQTILLHFMDMVDNIVEKIHYSSILC